VAPGSNITPVSFSPGNNAVKFFARAHPFMTDAKWYLTKDGYKVKYNENGIKGMEYFNDNGQWIASNRYLPINQVPAELIATVNNLYGRYSIFFAQEVKTSSGLVHIIKIENENTWKTLSICEGNIQLMESFNKH
ncbi:MAG: hypothetical protein ABI415_07145, partial [Flavitalea sp.]